MTSALEKNVLSGLGLASIIIAGVTVAYHLKTAGLEMTLAVNGRVAIELATNASFDLILMDMQMPEVDGYCAATE
ncbi:MAG: response regulator, partial [Tepidisphaeraceae bacterium]